MLWGVLNPFLFVNGKSVGLVLVLTPLPQGYPQNQFSALAFSMSNQVVLQLSKLYFALKFHKNN
jgi:hypothetical protein